MDYTTRHLARSEDVTVAPRGALLVEIRWRCRTEIDEERIRISMRNFRARLLIEVAFVFGFALLFDQSAVASGSGGGQPGLHVEEGVSVRDIQVAGNETQRLLFYGPTVDSRGVLIMFPGGTGEVGIARDGSVRHGENFVVRTRGLWARRGYEVVVVDALGQKSMRGIRSSSWYADVTRKIVAYVHSLSGANVWIMGTSQGSIAAMLAASTARPGIVSGVVLTEPVSVLGHSKETVFDAHPENVEIPALIVANRNDECWVAPPDHAEDIAKAMSRAATTVLFIDGGTSASANPCSSLAPHGYWGMDERVVERIDRWMRETRGT